MTPKIPRVFLAEPNRKFNFDEAKKYGSLVNVCDDFLNIFEPDKSTNALKAGFKSKKFDHETDYLCMTGNSVILSMMLATASIQYPSIRLLIFDSRQSAYCERVFTSPK